MTRSTRLPFWISCVLFALIAAAFCRAETTVVKPGSESSWQYYYKATEPKAGWQSPEFDDREWTPGVGPLGYGEKQLGTTLDFGTNPEAKPITAYFRHNFQIDDPKKLAQLKFMIRCDDGMVLYLNGKEVLRDNLPSGAVDFKTPALRDLDGIEERLYKRYSADASTLVAGKNVVAVEVHQSSASSDDLCFDMYLRSFDVGEDLRPSLNEKTKDAADAYCRKHYVAPGVTIPDGFADGGRRMVFLEDGHVTSRREILIVDRKRDTELQTLLKFSKSDEVMKLEPVERARSIATRIKSLDDPPSNLTWMDMMEGLNTYANEPVLIGDVSRICGTGVCRHRSLLFKLMADEAGLKVAIVKGNLNVGRSMLGAHAWNELHLDDGTKYVVDVAFRPENPVFPESKAVIYYTDDNQPMYKSPEIPGAKK